jgi:hypothetical protein
VGARTHRGSPDRLLALIVLALLPGLLGCDTKTLGSDDPEQRSMKLPYVYKGYYDYTITARSYTGKSVTCPSRDQIDITLSADGKATATFKLTMFTQQGADGTPRCNRGSTILTWSGTHDQGKFEMWQPCGDDGVAALAGTYTARGVDGSRECTWTNQFGGGTWTTTEKMSFEIVH